MLKQFDIMRLLTNTTEQNKMTKFSKGDKVFISKLKGIKRWFDSDNRSHSFNSFDSDGNAVIDVIICGKVWTQEVFSNIHQVKFHLDLS